MDQFADLMDFSTMNDSKSNVKKKLKTEKSRKVLKNAKGQTKITDCFKSEKRRVDRFDGFPEEELYSRCLPDHLAPNLDILIIGINPGLFAAFKGHHYAGPGNHFWKCLFLSGLIPEPLTALDDYKLINHGIGFTNIVQRTTRGSADLKPQEIKEGAKVLLEKIKIYRPRIAVFNGKEIFRIFSGRKDFDFGRQPATVDGTETLMYVMPSSSARCSQLPRAVDKVPFYIALRKLRDYLYGRIPQLSDHEVTFSSVLVTAPRKNGTTTADSPSKVVKREIAKTCDDEGGDDVGLDDNGRPNIVGPNYAFDLRLVKEEKLLDATKDDDERMNTYSARANSSEIAQLSSVFDKSPYFVGSTPDYPSDIQFNEQNLFGPSFFSSHSVTTAGVFDGNGIVNGVKEECGETDPQGGGDGGGEGGNNSQQTYENGSKEESTPAASNQLNSTDSAGSLSAQVPSAAQQTTSTSAVAAACSLNLSDTSKNYPISQQINGNGTIASSKVKTEPTATAAAVAHHPSTCNLPPEIALHVEEAIEAVVARAREGPLAMPAFRTPAEKSAAAHAHQQQQHQQQMFANLQLQAAVAAAHFDLSRGMKGADSVSVPAAALLGANYEQSCQASSGGAGGSANAPSLYSQYFQQPQGNQSSFPTAVSAGFGSSAAVGAGYGSQWTFATPTTSSSGGPNTVMYNHPSNMMAAAPYFQNAAAAFPTQQLYHQSAGSNAGASATAASNLPFSPTGGAYFNQQQAVAAQQQQSMYGNYAVGFNMQQQSPHNL